ncbi:SAM-dependent methyltransferase [Aliidiomarina iranensis]|uniref:SAM-dependent methyltransferase n=1 Tax=Aliidiomarina iranensis TaxID=1434071 RepID=A0A432VZY3_9GAMM|nr:cyclopropane-fatty-acyl-phospholipid synthase family protein [Aliidiomarina iranensis]RUO22306.1 SAM-dependent methyltransferase [Aliidiomarina iranensis]
MRISTDTVAISEVTMTKMERFAQKLMFRVLTHLRFGSLVIMHDKQIVAQFGVEGAEPCAHIEIHHPRTYSKFVFNGDIGAGDAFIAGDWSSPNVTKVIELFAANLAVMDKLSKRLSWISWPLQMLSHLRRRNSKTRAKENIAAHYDLGNELYTRFLDERMQYSSAVYPTADTSLDAAQEEKLRRLCDMLDLQPDDHLVEIGTGWGGLAIYAAEHYGCHVTTTTISEEQYKYAQELVVKKGLEDKITLLKEDYRDLRGQFDKLVSVEMIEAVGAEYMATFFRKCNDLLKPGGSMVLQAITISDQRLERYNRNVDFIQKYIFPGGYLPSVELISRMFRRNTDMVVRELDDIGLHYARTLADWRTRFNRKFTELQAFNYDDRFYRMWNYYLCYCEGGFNQRSISAVQLKATKNANLA